MKIACCVLARFDCRPEGSKPSRRKLSESVRVGMFAKN